MISLKLVLCVAICTLGTVNSYSQLARNINNNNEVAEGSLANNTWLSTEQLIAGGGIGFVLLLSFAVAGLCITRKQYTMHDGEIISTGHSPFQWNREMLHRCL